MNNSLGLWLFFGFIYWLIAWENGDIQAWNDGVDKYKKHEKCASEVFDFTSSFLFSLEGQFTIGYGSRSITEHCPHAIFIQFIQFVIAYTFDAVVCTVVFYKVYTITYT